MYKINTIDEVFDTFVRILVFFIFTQFLMLHFCELFDLFIFCR